MADIRGFFGSGGGGKKASAPIAPSPRLSSPQNSRASPKKAEPKVSKSPVPAPQVVKSLALAPALAPPAAQKKKKRTVLDDSDDDDDDADFESHKVKASKAAPTNKSSASAAPLAVDASSSGKRRKVIDEDEPVIVPKAAMAPATVAKSPAPVATSKVPPPPTPPPPPPPPVALVKTIASSADYFNTKSTGVAEQASKSVVTSKFFSASSKASVFIDDDDDVQMIGASAASTKIAAPAAVHSSVQHATTVARTPAQQRLISELNERDVPEKIALEACNQTQWRGVEDAMAWLEGEDFFATGKLKNSAKMTVVAPTAASVKTVAAIAADAKTTTTAAAKPKAPEASAPAAPVSSLDAPLTDGSAAPKRKWMPNQVRAAPPRAGQKDLPEGASLCLTGLNFVITGTLDSLEREQADDLISRYGGRTTVAVSGKTSYLVSGTEPGESKIAEARKKDIAIIDEDGLFELIRTLPENGLENEKKAPSKGKTTKKPTFTTHTPASAASSSSSAASSGTAVAVAIVSNGPYNPAPAASAVAASSASPSASTPAANVVAAPSSPSVAAVSANPFMAASTFAPRANPFGNTATGNFTASAAKSGTFSVSSSTSSSFSRPGVSVAAANQFSAKPSSPAISSVSYPTSSSFVSAGGNSLSSSSSSAPAVAIAGAPTGCVDASSLLWVDKYRPTRVDQLVGLGGIAQKLTDWLRGWEHHWLESGRARGADSDDSDADGKSSSSFKKPRTVAAALTGLRENSKAVLLSGPPGVGKTSCANLVAQQLGYEVVALNASDSRSKKVIKEQFGHLVQNRSMSEFFTADKRKLVTKRTLLIMDEVDGMGGGDRGGISELILMIRRAQMPIICIANDRGKPALKALVNYCFDMRVNKPHDQSVAKRLAAIAQSEGMNIEQNALEGISAMTHGDLRQAINLLYLWRRKNSHMKQTDLKGLRDASIKDMDKGVWSLAPVFFQRPRAGDQKWCDERIEAFFNDSMFMPGYVQDTYVTSRGPPPGSRADDILRHLSALAEAADSMSEATLVHRRVYSSQDYTLSQFHGFMACIRPGMCVAGNVAGNQFGFPSYLGKASTQRKNNRLISELTTHLGSNVSGGSRAVVLDYFPALRNKFSRPLMQKNMSKDEVSSTCAAVVEGMNQYGIGKEDVQETLWTLNTYGKFDEKDIASNIKSAFTRACTKFGKVFSTDALVKAVAGADADGGLADDDGLAADVSEVDEEEDEEENDDDDLKSSKTIKQKSSSSSSSSSATAKKK